MQPVYYGSKSLKLKLSQETLSVKSVKDIAERNYR